MERSFRAEIESLSLEEGKTFHGEGIVAVAKALLQSGVSYIGGYQGAPVSHLLDVLGEAVELLDDLGIYYEAGASEAGAAAMLGASINYPVRGAVTWKSTVGTNVASDAISNLASAGVNGGALIILGEDYGEGSSIIQERTHAFAMKSQVWLLDPRPNLPSIVNAVEKSFELSEASNTPVMIQLRIRACHLHGKFDCKDNRRPTISTRDPLTPVASDFTKINLPPSIYQHERQKIEDRWPAAVNFIRREKLNELFPGDDLGIGIIIPGGLYNALMRSLQQLGLADAFGQSSISIYVMNVVYPLVPEEIVEFCSHQEAVLVVEEGQPNYIEDAIQAILRRTGSATKIHGKNCLPMAGEYRGEVIVRGLSKFLDELDSCELDRDRIRAMKDSLLHTKKMAANLIKIPVPNRPPGFCIGCPERPVFSAIKQTQRALGNFHVSADIGCHTFGTLPPFNIGSTVLGYGLGLASSAGISHLTSNRTISIMGDGGFWHNGLTTGVVNSIYNGHDSVLVIMKNGYTSATGTQSIPSSPHHQSPSAVSLDIEGVLRGIGVKWIRVVHSYDVSEMTQIITEAMQTEQPGLKVVIADGECQLERQRRLKSERAEILRSKNRLVTTRFGVDEETCTGDHACIRLSGCPSLTIKPGPNPLRKDPIATINQNCVGCGLCGENAQSATLCPSFYKADVVTNPSLFERVIHTFRSKAISIMASDARWLGGSAQ